MQHPFGNIKKHIHECGTGEPKFCLPEGRRRRFKAGDLAQERCGHGICGKEKGDMIGIFSIFTIISMSLSKLQKIVKDREDWHVAIHGCAKSDMMREWTTRNVHWVGDAIQPSHPLLPTFSPAFSLAQHQSLFQWDGSSHHVAKALEFQLQHSGLISFRTDWLLYGRYCLKRFSCVN